MLRVATATHPGVVRSNNEDSLLWNPELGLLAVADGMGGHNAGDVASSLAVKTLEDYLRATNDGSPVDWMFGFDPNASISGNRLVTALKLANQEVFKAAKERPECEGMGTTLTVALVEGALLTFANVGDSRLYELRHGRFQQITRDDSWLEKLAEAPGITREAAEHHPMGHLLTNVIGPNATIDVAVQEIDLVDNHTLLLCSDGMYRMVPADDIRSMLEEPDVTKAADRLVRTAIEHGGKDNVTVVVARYSA
jgi:protein phosphatase